jgi:hypothetical protein
MAQRAGKADAKQRQRCGFRNLLDEGAGQHQVDLFLRDLVESRPVRKDTLIVWGTMRSFPPS